MWASPADGSLHHAPAVRAVGGMRAPWASEDPREHYYDRPERRPPRDVIHAVVGGFCLRRTTILTGLAHGAKREFGAVRIDGRETTWDYWYPHLGIAVDRTIRGAEEHAMKLAWATGHDIVYFSPYTNTRTPGRVDLEQLAEAVQERRSAAHEAV